MAGLVIIATTAEALALVRESVAGRVGAGEWVYTGSYDAPLGAAIEAARRAHGSAPLGVAARSATEAIEALELGADEALALVPGDVAAAHALVDRTLVRGRLREADANAKVNVAHAEKLAALGTLVAGVAHEVNNPLAAMMLTLEVLPRRAEAAGRIVDEVTQARALGTGISAAEVVRLASCAAPFGGLAAAREEIEQLKLCSDVIYNVVANLQAFARAEDAEIAQPVDVVTVIEPVIRLVGRQLSSFALVERDYGSGVPEVVTHRGRLTQVLMNVLINATHAIREVQRPRHRLRVSLRADDEAIAISVSDTGPGIPPEAIERIFDPFYTARRVHVGTGLGLPISRNLMRKMGGDLLVESVYGDGATFVVILPRSSPEAIEAARARQRTVPAAVPPPGRPAVLVVDDASALVRAYTRVLGPHFDVLVAADAEEAIEMLASGSHADAILGNLGESPRDAARLAEWLREHRPELARRIVFVSAEPELPAHRAILGDGPNVLLPKPMAASVLVAALQEAARR